MKSGIELIVEERMRQITEEGWTAKHDDQHTEGELALAGACYAVSCYRIFHFFNEFWPWDMKWWKPAGPIRNLTKAGALIAAEIDRLQRLEPKL